MTKAAPEGLRDAGRALWADVLGEVGEGWTLDARELHFLQRACRCADELEDLERAVDEDGVIVRGSRGQAITHPALAEARQLRLAQLRLLGAVQIPADDEQPRTVPALRAQRAAQSRWQREERARGA